jgi:hypothetical protein
MHFVLHRREIFSTASQSAILRDVTIAERFQETFTTLSAVIGKNVLGVTNNYSVAIVSPLKKNYRTEQSTKTKDR